MAGATVRRALGVTTKAATDAMAGGKVRVQRGLFFKDIRLQVDGCGVFLVIPRLKSTSLRV